MTTTLTLTNADEQLVQQVAQGDHEAFNRFYERFSSTVAYHVRRVLGRAAEVEDVCQDVFLLLWNEAHRYDPTRGSPSAWIATLARRRAIDHLRSTHKQSPHRTFNEEGDPTQGRQGPAQVDADQPEIARRALKALSTLPVSQQTVINLACSQGLRRRHIAAVEGLPLGTVKTLLGRGFHRLRGMMDPAAA